MSGSVVQMIVAVLLLLFVFYRVWMLIKQNRLNNTSMTWPVTPAKVIHKEVVTHRSSRGNTSYTPVVTYQYFVLGSEYNHKIRLSGLWGRSGAQKTLDKIEDTLEVRYNPDNPNENTHRYTKTKFMDYLVVVALAGLAAFILVQQLMK